jgi:transcription-repair coupling factor (superfamily II helicase)
MPARSIILNQKTFIKKALDFSIVELSVKPIFRIAHKFEFYIHTALIQQFDLLLNNLSENHFNGYKNYLFCSNEARPNVFMIFLKV